MSARHHSQCFRTRQQLQRQRPWSRQEPGRSTQLVQHLSEGPVGAALGSKLAFPWGPSAGQTLQGTEGLTEWWSLKQMLAKNKRTSWPLPSTSPFCGALLRAPWLHLSRMSEGPGHPPSCLLHKAAVGQLHKCSNSLRTAVRTSGW